MPLVVRHHEKLELNRVEYSGFVTFAELKANAEFHAMHPAWLCFDCLSYILPGADMSTINLTELDTVFRGYRSLFEPMQFLIMRRSAWLCESPSAQGHLDHWLGDGDIKNKMSTDARQFDNFEDAGEWLVLSPAGKAALRSGEGFEEIIRFDIPLPARTMAR